MNIVCAGISHHLAPVEVRERFSVGEHELPEVLRALRGLDGVAGAVVISTCNRVEFYTAALCPARAVGLVKDWLVSRAGGEREAPFYEFNTPQSARHLFRVSCGLDSMVLGETEVLGQVKRAYERALKAGAASRHLHKLFQHAFRAAKLARTQTGIARGASSVASVAVELAGKIFGDLSGRRVMILGAGETGERVARGLQSRGVRSVIVASRTFDRAAKLAQEIGGLAVHFEHWESVFDEVDILIGSTGAPHHVLERARIEPRLRRRGGRPLFLIDLAVPRDFAPDVQELEGVYLYDIDSLRSIAEQNQAARREEIRRCEAIIEEEVRRYLAWLKSSSDFYAGEDGQWR